MVGRDRGDRLARVAHDVAGEHRLVAVLEPVAVAPGDVVGGEDARARRGSRSAGDDVDAEDAGRRVRRAQRLTPQHALGPQVAGERELARTLGTPSGRVADSPTATAARVAVGADARRHGVAPPAPVGDRATRPRRAPGRSPVQRHRLPRDRLADLEVVGRVRARSSRSWTAITRPGVQKPHCTAPASTNAAARR